MSTPSFSAVPGISCASPVAPFTDTVRRNYRDWILRKNAGQTELVWVGRAMVMAIALVAIMIARNPEAKVLGMVSYAWAGFGAAFGPVLILSLFWSRMTRNGALAGMLVGAVTVVLWKQVGWFGLYEIIPGFILAWLATVVVSHLSQPTFIMVA